MVIETITYVSVAFFIGMLIGLWYYNGEVNRLHYKCAKLESRCDKYQRSYLNIRKLIHHLSDSDVEILQKDYATWIMMKNVDMDFLCECDDEFYDG